VDGGGDAGFADVSAGTGLEEPSEAAAGLGAGSDVAAPLSSELVDSADGLLSSAEEAAFDA
jgi:hypothetical protein